MNNNETKLTLNITTNTTEFESAMKRATEAAHAFRTALQELPWYFRWIMAVQRVLDKLFPKRRKYAEGGVVKPGKTYVVGEGCGCSGGIVSREAGERYFRVGVTREEIATAWDVVRHKQETAAPVPAYWRNGQE